MRGLSPDHQNTLEASLLERFDRMHPKERSMKKTIRRVGFAFAAVAGVGIVACGAPAEVGVAGTWLSVSVPAGIELPDPEGIARVVDESGAGEVQLSVRRTSDGTTLEITMWGEDLSKEPIAARLVQAFPALAGADIREKPLEAKVRVTIAEKIGHDWFERDLAAGNIEEAKQRLVDEIRAREGVDAKIDVRITDDGSGRREVNVKVTKEDAVEPDHD